MKRRHTPQQPPPQQQQRLDRGQMMGVWLAAVARWSARVAIVLVTTVLVLWVLSVLWVGVLPVIFALVVTALLSPTREWMATRGINSAISAALTLVATIAVLVAITLYILPDVIEQLEDIGSTALSGLDQVQDALAEPPFNLNTEAINNAVDDALSWAKDRSDVIASSAFSGIAAAGSVLINTLLILVLTFFFLKDGHKFLPWTRDLLGRSSGHHVSEVLTRNWNMLGSFIRTQALVSAIDGIFIGLGLVLLNVPLALALAIITFFAGFIPIVGAVSAGVLAVLVALVSNGWQTALAVAGLVLLVQQLEGNVLSPMLQGKTLQVHPGLVLVSVTVGSTIFGIVGAFLAVPFTAALAVTGRYLSEQLDERTQPKETARQDL